MAKTLGLAWNMKFSSSAVRGDAACGGDGAREACCSGESNRQGFEAGGQSGGAELGQFFRRGDFAQQADGDGRQASFAEIVA